MKGSCFQCGKKETTVKAIFNDHGHKGYFCNVACLQKFQKKDPQNLNELKQKISRTISTWTDGTENGGYYGTICGMLMEPTENAFVINRATACLFVAKCQDEQKLLAVSNYVSSLPSCVIL